MKTKITAVALMAVTAGVFAYTHQNNTAPSDLRDAVADSSLDTLKNNSGVEASDVSSPEPQIKPFYVDTYFKDPGANGGSAAGGAKEQKAVALPGVDGATFPPDEIVPAEWVTINGGTFTMGTDSGEKVFKNAKPLHEVNIKTFEMSKTLVTVEQYAECVRQKRCGEPSSGDYCNWGQPGRRHHPVNCVTRGQAQAYAAFKGARLPTEAEWEYAATSGGRNQKYPWGNDAPTSELVGFNTNSTMPVCSKPKGNTAQGLCDMSGNLQQWVQDAYKDSYSGAPVDGSAFFDNGWGHWVLRGGSFRYIDAISLRSDIRYGSTGGDSIHIGVRLAR